MLSWLFCFLDFISKAKVMDNTSYEKYFMTSGNLGQVNGKCTMYVRQ